MALPLSQLPQEIIREVRQRKGLAFLLFVVVSFAVLGAGFIWPYKYQAGTIIFVDDRNIIAPLMEGRAVTTKINDRTSAARELLMSRTLIERVASDPEIYRNASMDPDALEGRIAKIRSGLSVRPRGDSYFSIGFSSTSQMEAFRVAQKLGQVFIEETKDRKRSESRNAYDFIDKQVKSYEQQLTHAENRLKQFLSENTDGTEQEANSRMAQLRNQLELAQLEKEELRTRIGSLQGQLNNIRPTIRQGRTEDAFRERIRTLEERLDALRLQYHDTYPDIVITQEQLAELKRQRDLAAAQQGGTTSLDGEEAVNPLYQELSAALSKTRADMATIDTRINSLQRLMEQQTQRMERIQANKAQYSELTRDMEVNREIYDDLLKRREKARVSMHLDIEGQGLNYRINEAAQFPRTPSGPQFSMFAMAGLFLGLAAPFGAVAGLLQVDPRIRARKQLEDGIGLPVLIEIPEVRTPFEKRRDRRVTMMVGIFVVLTAAVYITIVVLAQLGVI
ncbi:XrtA system polysaccharide chain length determinant [Marinobacter shengliensis]|uniref:XrtA system polysaccharide chain length determinant n=1 Tax=Marinobacter shengliensis TaxID=1389223 RepID=UPI000D101D96|nr:XrtA system polysaccharide chain length determinant [Marinobacter shengliensis]PSF11227.1 lipopolysaccharide biosynthesis protein [Marinobacter shengliensis]